MAEKHFIVKDKQKNKIDYTQKIDDIHNTVELNDQTSVENSLDLLEQNEIEVKQIQNQALKSRHRKNVTMIVAGVVALVSAVGLIFGWTALDDSLPIQKMVYSLAAGGVIAGAAGVVTGIWGHKAKKKIKGCTKHIKSVEELRSKLSRKLVAEDKDVLLDAEDKIKKSNPVLQEEGKNPVPKNLNPLDLKIVKPVVEEGPKYIFQVKSTIKNSDKKGSITKNLINYKAEPQEMLEKLSDEKLPQRLKTLSEQIDDSNAEIIKCHTKVIITDVSNPEGTKEITYKDGKTFLAETVKNIEDIKKLAKVQIEIDKEAEEDVPTK